ncbi:MAG: GerMN domain-containing protein [Eubacteriales bacterium]|nr:GerMN domain-containing protein [Eubacteriales bacterium]
MLKKILVALVAFIMLLGFAACGGDKDEEPYEEIPAANMSDTNMRETVLYLEDDFGYIVPVMKEIAWVEGIGAAAVSELIADPNTDADMAYMGLNPILAEGTTISLNIVDGVATIQLSEGAISADDAVGEMNKIVALVNTLTEFVTVDTVFIEQAGTDGTLPNGTDLSSGFSAFDLNVVSALSSGDIENASKIMLYFVNADETVIVPVTKYVGGEADAFAAMNELLKGPGDGGLKDLFPEGTELLSVEVDDAGIATVELSGDFTTISDDTQKEEMLKKCLILTLMQFDNIDVVRILVDGEEYMDTSKTTMAYAGYVNTLE